MAATNVYCSIRPVTVNGGTAVQFTNIQATSAAFQLGAGNWFVSVIASTYGTVTLQILGPDNATYLTAMTAFSANGNATANLPAGTYKLALG